MKIMTIVGTRPELIRLSRIIPLLDKYCDHVFVHTGQNFDVNLKDIFFKSLELRDPDYQENCAGKTTFETISNILQMTERLIIKEKPDKLLILGDTNSGLSAFVAKRYGVKVYHMEAGNRCYDDIVPEEINRRIIDSCTDIWMPYTERSRQYLLREGIPPQKIFVIGNPIFEVLEYYSDKILQSKILDTVGLSANKYLLVTMHRSENIDNPYILDSLLRSFDVLRTIYPLLVSVHPHTRLKLNNRHLSDKIILSDPFNFIDFIALEMNSYCVITDSGTVQEECSILGIPNVIIRTTNERLETIENGNNILSGYKPSDIMNGVKVAVDLSPRRLNDFVIKAPEEYITPNVSEIVSKIILGAYP
jgi:UDP-N-acetylglucosamine 2-epimerase (non-hydrolysing)